MKGRVFFQNIKMSKWRLCLNDANKTTEYILQAKCEMEVKRKFEEQISKVIQMSMNSPSGLDSPNCLSIWVVILENKTIEEFGDSLAPGLLSLLS